MTPVRVEPAASRSRIFNCIIFSPIFFGGAQWLSGRMLDLRSNGLQVRASYASLRCVLEQDTLLVIMLKGYFALHMFLILYI